MNLIEVVSLNKKWAKYNFLVKNCSIWIRSGGGKNLLKNKIRKLVYDNVYLHILYLKISALKNKNYAELNDESYATKFYKNATGKVLDLKEPRTFDEKLWWLKIHNRDPLLTFCTDKYLVREYVKECGFEEILTKIYGVWNNVEDIDYETLPNSFFLKCNHTCGANVACLDKKKFDFIKAKVLLSYYMNTNHYNVSREWNYKNIVPKLMCEEVLKNDDNSPLVDYKFYCFSGEPKLLLRCQGVADKDGSHASSNNSYENFYDIDFKPINVKEVCRQIDYNRVIKPKSFDFMVNCSRKLSKRFPFCRVDLYEVNNKVYFGELTFYCGGGVHRYKPEKFNLTLGQYIDLDKFKDDYIFSKNNIK